MTSGVRFGAAQARMRALKSRLWTPLDRPLLVRAGLAPDGRALTDDPRDTWRGVVRWYQTFIAVYPSGASIFRALFRRHEIENLKLLWRAARRARPPDASCWRPLDPLGTLSMPPRAERVSELVDRLAATPFAPVAGALAREENPAATEIGLDRWLWTDLWRQALALPRRETGARALVRLLVLEHDADLLRRADAFGVAPDLVVKATVMLSRERRAAAVRTPPGTAAPAWATELLRLRHARLRACRRAFVGWPFQLGPAVAALLLREEQAFAMLRICAARRGETAAHDALPLALAAGPMEG